MADSELFEKGVAGGRSHGFPGLQVEDPNLHQVEPQHLLPRVAGGSEDQDTHLVPLSLSQSARQRRNNWLGNQLAACEQVHTHQAGVFLLERTNPEEAGGVPGPQLADDETDDLHQGLARNVSAPGVSLTSSRP